MLNKSEPALEGGLNDLVPYAKDELWNMESVCRAFRGTRDTEFRVPAADTGKELFFRERELLARWTSMTHPLQKALLKAIREAMAAHKVDRLNLRVPWGSEMRVIYIREINSDGCLNIYLNSH
ncbi:MAG: hypothetical protein HY455_03185 [Parcubacteria group bacterium]|nr:hypothetical protein [Parcubacteria group bacterium]